MEIFVKSWQILTFCEKTESLGFPYISGKFTQRRSVCSSENMGVDLIVNEERFSPEASTKDRQE